MSVPRVVMREGLANDLAPFVRDLNGSSVLLITDAGLLRTGLIEPAKASLVRAGLAVSVYSDVEADPPVAVIEAAVEAGRRAKANVVLGIGGGSTLDTAKLAAYLLGSGDRLDGIYGVGKATGKRLPLMLVPTTAGTGSEVTPISIVTTVDGKQGVVAQKLLPDIALLDPRLTLSMPSAASAATGIDAIVHAVEAFTSRIRKNPISDTFAKESLRLLSSHLIHVLREPGHLGARGAMLLGACLAGMAFANAPVAAVHALAYPLGVRYHAPHGLTNALMLLPVLRFNLGAAESLYAELAEELGLRAATSEGFIQHIEALLHASELPLRLRDIGATVDDIPALAQSAMQQTRLLVNNPREITLEDAVALYQAAY
ncbi:iron-containing alcohol dehydrogenase [Variovorax sp. V118]|uniref:iron-containing alcohol dehydrogenase n=1 Tax=Variovorax sp. V118 TaxID=3065954 RepID=UPI0034E8CDCC